MGSSVGNNDLFDSGSLGTATSVTATGLPTDGSQLHVRLRYLQGGVWSFSDFEYTAANIATSAPGVLALSLPTNDLVYDPVSGFALRERPRPRRRHGQQYRSHRSHHRGDGDAGCS